MITLSGNEIARLREALETINQEYFELQKSKEYQIGCKIVKLMSLTPKKAMKEYLLKRRIRKCRNYNQMVNYPNTSKKDYLRESKKTVVYTCVTGNYDNVRDPVYIPDNVDFVLFTEKSNIHKLCKNLQRWQVKELPSIPHYVESLVMENRYIKLHPHEYFPEYDYSLYIDGNVRVIGDVCSLLCNTNNDTGLAFHRHRQRKSVYYEAEVCKLLGKGNKKYIDIQMNKYKNAGFPENFGLYEATVIATDLSNPNAERLYNIWWSELLETKSGRDQLSLPYIIWKSGFEYEQVGNLGNDLYSNKIFQIVAHK